MGDAKPLVWLHGEVKTPPFSWEARREAGFFLRRLQMGETLPLPHSRPMPSLGGACHELRVMDEGLSWRIVYAIEEDAIVILAVFPKKTARTPKKVLDSCRLRLRRYREI